MPDLNDVVAITVDGEPVSLEDTLRRAKWRFQLGFLREVADFAIIRRAVSERGIRVTDAELQQASVAFRQKHKLYESKALQRWLWTNRLKAEDWELLLEEEVAEEKLRAELTADSINRHFAEKRLSFDAVTVSQIILKDEGVAREVRAAIVEDGADFYSMARQHSIDEPTRPAGGYSGRITRSDLESRLASAVFGARSGDIVGPLKSDEGWRIIKVEARHPATLDDATRESIQAALFEEWMEERRGKSKITYPLIDL